VLDNDSCREGDPNIYSRITSTMSLSFCVTTFGPNLTYRTVSLPQLLFKQTNSGTSTALSAEHSDLGAHDFAHSPDLWQQSRLSSFTCIWSWRFCGIKPSILVLRIYGTVVVMCTACSSYLYSAWGICASCGSYVYICFNIDDTSLREVVPRQTLIFSFIHFISFDCKSLP